MRLREGTRASMQDQTWSRTGTPLSSNSCVLILLGVQWGGSGACNRKCACREKKFWKIILPFFSNQEGSHRPHLARKWAPGSGTRGPWNFSGLARSYIAFASRSVKTCPPSTMMGLVEPMDSGILGSIPGPDHFASSVRTTRPLAYIH